MLRFASCCQSVILLFYCPNLVRHIISESFCSPFAAPSCSFDRSPCLYVPCQVHTELQFCLSRLDVSHVDNPQALYSLLITTRQLITDLRRADGRKPEIILRRSPVTDMVVYAVRAGTSLLCIGRHLAYETVIIVNPCQRYIVWHLQTCIVSIQNLLIRNECLWHLRHILVNNIMNETALEGNNLRQSGSNIARATVSLYCSIVDTTHSQRVHHILILAFHHTLTPVFLNTGWIRCIVIRRTACSPFAHIIAKHRFAVTRTENNIILRRQLWIFFYFPESSAAWMHSWPHNVGTQAQQQLKYFLVCPWTYILDISIHIRCSPRLQSPVLVIDKYSTEADRRFVNVKYSFRSIKRTA